LIGLTLQTISNVHRALEASLDVHSASGDGTIPTVAPPGPPDGPKGASTIAWQKEFCFEKDWQMMWDFSFEKSKEIFVPSWMSLFAG